MSLLILSSSRDASIPYHEWLAGYTQRVHLICSENRVTPNGFYDTVQRFSHYETNGQVELAALALHKISPIDRIIARTEADILRAAALREKLGISGQLLASANAYRNKLVMKECFRAAKITCAASAPARTPMDLINFAAIHGLPIVVKPIDGSGGKDTTILRDTAAFAAYLAEGIGSNMMVESFVPGDFR